ncbi:serine hydrolase [Dolosicoccus paucivorans]|uniref:Serine hydrolase n=1 Tax=Dolosicoccus paucivorans TaxID=84521 RepID=A0A1G8NCZ5_9LACT|nr:serine hydrolase [Dolosicoccus paucivorans]PMB84751.1 serine hydrolase [Dolosicoccus paucivorans]PMC58779.1 serine hydrolase [Dolosicoccus paucivorans]SDI78023.1 Beta-lactamase enzyme family protein [Dolosicoccus paucivorans]
MKEHKYYLILVTSILSICLASVFFLIRAQKSNQLVEESTSSIVATSLSSSNDVSLPESSVSTHSELEESEESSSQEVEESLPFYNSADELMTDMLEKYAMDPSNLAISYYNFNSGETYHLNEEVAMMAASTNKVTTAVMFTDLVNQGVLTWDTPFVYNPALYEEGGGTITNGTPQASYPLEEVIYESLYYSDNTAWNMLIDWYYRNIGDFQEGSKIVSGVDFIDPNINIVNYATSNMLLSVLNKVVTEPQYDFIKQTMLESQDDLFLKREFNEGFGAKYGQYEDNFHDIGFYIKDGAPQYLIVVLSTHGAGNEEFLGDLNLHLRQYNEDQFHSY